MEQTLSQQQEAGKCIQSGFTLVEVLVVIAIIGILAMIAIPSYSDSIDRQRIKSAAETLAADLRWAKAESSRRNTNITVTFTTGASWSYTIQANKADGTKETLRTVNNVDFVNVSVNQTTFGSNDFEIDYIRGTVGDNGSVVFKTSRGNTATVTVSALGRVRICGFGGYPACS